jgi:hypothetical protein
MNFRRSRAPARATDGRDAVNLAGERAVGLPQAKTADEGVVVVPQAGARGKFFQFF